MELQNLSFDDFFEVPDNEDNKISSSPILEGSDGEHQLTSNKEITGKPFSNCSGQAIIPSSLELPSHVEQTIAQVEKDIELTQNERSWFYHVSTDGKLLSRTLSRSAILSPTRHTPSYAHVSSKLDSPFISSSNSTPINRWIQKQHALGCQSKETKTIFDPTLHSCSVQAKASRTPVQKSVQDTPVLAKPRNSKDNLILQALRSANFDPNTVSDEQLEAMWTMNTEPKLPAHIGELFPPHQSTDGSPANNSSLAMKENASSESLPSPVRRRRYSISSLPLSPVRKKPSQITPSRNSRLPVFNHDRVKHRLDAQQARTTHEDISATTSQRQKATASCQQSAFNPQSCPRSSIPSRTVRNIRIPLSPRTGFSFRQKVLASETPTDLPNQPTPTSPLKRRIRPVLTVMEADCDENTEPRSPSLRLFDEQLEMSINTGNVSFGKQLPRSPPSVTESMLASTSKYDPIRKNRTVSSAEQVSLCTKHVGNTRS